MDDNLVRIGHCWSDNKILTIALFIRIIFILYARIHDYLFNVNFTDVDYHVFTDAAYFVTQGKSPYDRTTYRYTPMIAYFLIPNIFFPDFGKLLFSIFDVLVGWFHLRILKDELQQKNKSIRLCICLLWLFNPFNIIIATRGNSDSFVCFLLMLTLYTLISKKYLYLSAIAHGAGATQLRIFPIILLPSIFLNLSGYQYDKWKGMRAFVFNCLNNKRGFVYIFLSLISFGLLTTFYQFIYGKAFFDSFILYHFMRVDIRHNFSIYFLSLYLNMSQPIYVKLLGIVAFMPQVLCIIAFAIRYSKDLPFCWFITTFAFVSFNKVSTSQYFIWYLCFIPLIYTRIKMDPKRCIKLFIVWIISQANWLLPAYLLEFNGFNCFMWIWLSSLTFLIINLYIIIDFIRAYCPVDSTIKLQ